MKKFMQEFGKFIQRGNVIDLAVGVVIGNAFGKIVTSLVDNVLMPVIGMILGNIDFTDLMIKVNLWGRTTSIKYGMFIQNVVDFLIVAFCIFMVVKGVNKITEKLDELRKKEEEEAEEEKDAEIALLEEIRDLLKKEKKTTKKTTKKEAK